MGRFKILCDSTMESHFINNIIPRLRRFAVNIEIKEVLVDKIWEIFDDPENVHDYQFLRDQRLIMTHNGDVKYGRWEILPNNRLLIDRGNDKPINLIYDFSIQGQGAVIMRKAGNNQTPFLLFDKNVIPDGDIIRYLEEREKSIKGISPVAIGEIDAEDTFFMVVCVVVLLLAFVFIVANLK